MLTGPEVGPKRSFWPGVVSGFSQLLPDGPTPAFRRFCRIHFGRESRHTANSIGLKTRGYVASSLADGPCATLHPQPSQPSEGDGVSGKHFSHGHQQLSSASGPTGAPARVVIGTAE